MLALAASSFDEAAEEGERAEEVPLGAMADEVHPWE